MSAGPLISRPFPWPLFRHWAGRMLVLWVLLGALIFLVQSILAAVLRDRDDIVIFMRMMDKMPKVFKAMLGGDDLMPSNLSAIVAIGYQHPTILTSLFVNAIWVPVALLTSPMQLGTMELLLARPITRTRVYWMAATLGILSEVALVAIVFLGTAVGTQFLDFADEIQIFPFARVAVNLAALALAIMGFAFFAAAWLSETSRVVGVVVGFIVTSYLLQFAVLWLPRLEPLHPLTIFYYCNANAVIEADAMPWANLAALLSFSAVGFVGGWLRWRSRDMQAA